MKRAGETYSSLDLGTIGHYVIGLYDRWPRSLSFPT